MEGLLRGTSGLSTVEQDNGVQSEWQRGKADSVPKWSKRAFIIFLLPRRWCRERSIIVQLTDAPVVGAADAAVVATAPHARTQPIHLVGLKPEVRRAAETIAQAEIHTRHALIERRQAAVLTDQHFVRPIGGFAVKALRLRGKGDDGG